MSDNPEDAGLLETVTAAPRPAEAESATSLPDWRYRDATLIGSGGMGSVYRAFDPTLERHVALKVLRQRHANETARARLLREARAMARLSHPNVMGVYEVGTTEGHDYIAMELIEGGNLAEWLEREDRPWRDRLQAMIKAGRGLEAAHRAGLIHRDFKPGNVLMSDDGRVLVTDFGLARQSDDVEEPVDDGAGTSGLDSLTRPGAVMGTPLYMSAEQHDGLAVDARTDQFSFCVATFQALYGTLPFGGRTFAQVRKAIEEGPVMPLRDELPPRVRNAIRRGLQFLPKKRFDDMGQLLGELERAVQPRRNRWLLVGGAALVVAIAVAAIVVMRGRGTVDKRADACDGIDARFASAWDSRQSERLRRAFSPFDADGKAFSAFARAMDDYRRSWLDTYTRACETRSSADDGRFHSTLGCLLRRRDQAQSFVAEIGQVDLELVANASRSARELAEPDICAGASSTQASGVPPLPSDPDKRKQVLALKRELAAVHALQRSEQKDKVVERARVVRERAEKLGYHPLVSAASMTLAGIYTDWRQIPTAQRHFERAIEAAEIGNAFRAQARALIGLADLKTRFSMNLKESRAIIKRAVAALARYGGDPVQRARLQLIEARVDIREQRFAKALSRALEAKTAFNKRRAHFGVAWAYNVMVSAEIAAGHHRSAYAYARKRLSLLEREASADRATIAMAIESVGELEQLQGRFEEAKRTYARAEALWRHTKAAARLRADSYARATANVRGKVLDELGRPVAGADVVGSLEGVWGNARYAQSWRGVHYDTKQRVRRVRTDDNGEFLLAALPVGRRYHLAAEHDAKGRSKYDAVVVGRRNDLVLRLIRFGSVQGTVSGQGKRPAFYHLHVVPPKHDFLVANRLEVQIGDDDRFRIDRLPAGKHLLQVAEGESGRFSVAAVKTIVVRPGKVTTVALQLDYRGVAVAVDVVGETPGAISGGVVALFHGRVEPLPTQGDALIAVYSEKTKQGRAALLQAERLYRGQGFRAKFRGLADGHYTLCAAGLSGDIQDPRYFAKVRKHRRQIPVRCARVDISGAPPKPLRIAVPAPPRLK